MKRFVKWLTGGLLLMLLVVLPGAIAWISATQTGTRWVLQELLVPAVPGLRLAAVQGRLAGAVQLNDLHYADDQLSISVAHLSLDWSPVELLQGRVLIHSLQADGVEYAQLAAGSDEPLQLPERISLPLAIIVQDLTIQDLRVTGSPGAAAQPIGRIALAGRFADAQLELERLSLQRPDVQLEGTAALLAAGDYPLQGSLHWEATLPDQAPLSGDTRFEGTLQQLQIEQSIAPPYAVQLDLTVSELLTAVHLAGVAQLQDSNLPAINPGWPDMRITGKLQVNGAPQALQIDSQLALQDAQAGVANLVLAAQLLPAALQVASLQLTSPGRPVHLQAAGTLGLGEQPEFDFRAHWSALAWPLDGTPDYQSRAGELLLSGTPDAYRVEAQGDVQVRDLLTGKLDLRARSAESAGNWLVERARLFSAGSYLEASGQAGAENRINWKLHAPSLADFSPRAEGQLEGQGSLQGTLDKPTIRLQAQGRGLHVEQYRVGALDITANVSLAAGQSSKVHGELRDALLDGTMVHELLLDASGTQQQHSAQLELKSSQGDAKVALAGNWDNHRWRFDLQRARLAAAQLAPWRLSQPVSGELGDKGLRLPEHCWQSMPSRLCLQFSGTATAYNGSFSLTELPLAYFSPLLPATVSLDGSLQGQGTFRAIGAKDLTVKARLDSTPVRLGLPADEAGQQVFSFAPGEAVVTVAGRNAAASLALPLAEGAGGINAQTRLTAPANGNWRQAVLEGEWQLDWPDIALARQWIAEVTELHGQVNGRVRLDGTLEQPRLTGRLALEQASASLLTPGITLQDVSVLLNGEPTGVVQIEAQAQSGGGTLSAKGQYDVLQQQGALQLTGKDFQVMDTPEAKIFATPDLTLEMNADHASVAGQVLIPTAQLRPQTPPPSAVSVSPDQVIVRDETVVQDSKGFALDSRVRVVLGDDVDIDGLGLAGKLQGDVLVIAPAHQPPTASGELSIKDGRYEAYGQQLSITTGRLLFAGGPVTEPGLDIEAVRKPAPDIKVGVRARGQLRAPQFSVFSEPSMPQSEQLSWLVLGKPLQGGASAGERSALQTAALMLGMNRGDALGKRIGESLGFDEVSVGAEPGSDVNQASLLVGKYLTPELFVSYGIGLFEPVATLRMRYALSSRWKLVGETAAEASSGDLFYEIEQRD